MVDATGLYLYETAGFTVLGEDDEYSDKLLLFIANYNSVLNKSLPRIGLYSTSHLHLGRFHSSLSLSICSLARI